MTKQQFNDQLMSIIQEHLPKQEDDESIGQNDTQEDQTVNETPKEDETKSDESESQNEVNIDKELSGLPKELVEAVKTFKDPEDRAKAIKIAKEQRAREDRLHLQLGNTKKELDNVSGLLQRIETNPAETFKALAKRVNFDLRQAVDEPVQDDYLTPEELINKRAKDIQQQTYLTYQQELNQREAKELLADFLEDKPDDTLIYENQSVFVSFFNENIAKKQQELGESYIPKKFKMQAMKDAYEKLERLQPDYETKIKAKIKKELEETSKAKFEEAKKQQKISKPIANSNKSLTTSELIYQMVKDFSRANK
ncbi:MAG: hypothetical protein RL769_9 [Pseudomonadota bacterium]|jgi:hypothetical protein